MAGGTESDKQKLIERLIGHGYLFGAERHIQQQPDINSDHAACIIAKSDQWLIFYICGYLAKKIILKTECEKCCALLLTGKDTILRLGAAEYTKLRDNGSLLYPHDRLCRFIRQLENIFTSCFSTPELHHDSVMDVQSQGKKIATSDS